MRCPQCQSNKAVEQSGYPRPYDLRCRICSNPNDINTYFDSEPDPKKNPPPYKHYDASNPGSYHFPHGGKK